jgi:hypothetical protein
VHGYSGFAPAGSGFAPSKPVRIPRSEANLKDQHKAGLLNLVLGEGFEPPNSKEG